MKTLITIISLAFAFHTLKANLLSDETATFKVSGNCEMCKKRIEGSLKRTGIKSANWNVDSKIVTVVYDSQSAKPEDLHKYISDAGYDTEKMKASDKSYEKLPGCCQYERAK